MPENERDNPQLEAAVTAVQEVIKLWLGTYHRHQILKEAVEPDQPALIIGNHGYGGIFDLNIIAAFAALQTKFDRPFVTMAHEAAWKLPVVKQIVEINGAVTASPEAVAQALDDGNHVLIFPGGDIDSGKPFVRRNRIYFSGRAGFARVAIQHNTPIVPLITAGAGEGGFVLTDGQTLAKITGMKQKLNHTTLPVGFGMLGPHASVLGFQIPYFPLPTRLQSVLMPAMWHEQDESAQHYAKRVESAMQERMNKLVKGRIPVLGIKNPLSR